jgi:hypothetical protein
VIWNSFFCQNTEGVSLLTFVRCPFDIWVYWNKNALRWIDFDTLRACFSLFLWFLKNNFLHLKSVQLMKKQGCFILFHFLLSVFAFGKTMTLQDAMRQKSVSSTVVRQTNPAGDGRNFHLSVKNLTKESLTIIVPVGFVFKAVDSTVQDFIHLENKELSMTALATSTLFVKAMCIRASRRGPSNGAVFLATTLASPNLLALTTFALQQNLYNENSLQFALWAASDNESLVGIDNPILMKFTAQHLGRPIPDYTVHYEHRETPGQTAALSLTPLEIKATFQYTLPTDQQVKLDLVDAAGKSVLSEYNLVQTMNQTKGRHRFSLTLELTGVPRGTYSMKMTSTNDGKVWASKQVVF